MEHTKPLPCKKCFSVMRATGVLQKTNPPKYEYKCGTGHVAFVAAIEAEIR